MWGWILGGAAALYFLTRDKAGASAAPKIDLIALFEPDTGAKLLQPGEKPKAKNQWAWDAEKATGIPVGFWDSAIGNLEDASEVKAEFDAWAKKFATQDAFAQAVAAALPEIVKQAADAAWAAIAKAGYTAQSPRKAVRDTAVLAMRAAIKAYASAKSA